MKNEVMVSPLHGEENLLKSDKKVIRGAKKGVIPEYLYYRSEHLYTYKNSAFGDAFLLVKLEHNACAIKAINSRYLHEENGKYYLITTNEARYKSWYKQFNVNTSTGEIEAIIKESDSLIRQRGKIINTLKTFDRIYKISGRYSLNKNFNELLHRDSNKIIVSQRRRSQFPSVVTGSRYQYMSRLWSWPSSLSPLILQSYKDGLAYIRNQIDRGRYCDIEHMLYMYLPEYLVQPASIIGVEGELGPNGASVSD
jgi:hypothetical protein